MTERPDGTNINNWHWVEKNAEPWSRIELKSLLINQTIEKDSVKVFLKDFKKLEGDATANNRKGKLIFLYDWIIEIETIVTVAGSELEYKCVLEIPNLSEENEAHEIDLNLTIETRGPNEHQIRHIVNNDVLEFVRKQLGIYIHKLKVEFSKGLILETNKPQAVVKDGKAKMFDKREFQNEIVTGSGTQKAPQRVDVTSFEISEAFKVPPSRLFEILTSEELVKAWAGQSSIEPKVGGKFVLFGGQISGKFTSLKENEEIVAEWRLKDYPAGHFATIRFLFNDQSDSTNFVIKAENVPSNQSEKTQEGLNRHYLKGIGRTFCISSQIF